MEGHFETVLSCFEHSKIRGPFPLSLGTVLGLESGFVFAVCAFMNKVSMILKIIQQKYELQKNN